MSSGGGGGSSSSTTQQSPEMQSFVNQTLPYIQQTQSANPLYNFANTFNRQIPGMSPSQQQASEYVPTLQQTPQATQQAQSLLNQFQGPPGSSPASQAALNAFTQLQQPTIQNNLNTMGLGRSGIGADIIQRAQTQATLPLIQQDLTNQLAAAGQLGQLGGQDVTRQATAAGLLQSQGTTERGVAQEIANAPYEEYLRQQNLAQATTLPGGTVPASPQSTTSQTNKGSSFFGKVFLLFPLLGGLAHFLS